MKVVHVTEAFEDGALEFLKCLTKGTPDIDYVIIYGRSHVYEREHQSFPPNVKFTAWPGIKTKISLVKDARSLQQLIEIIKQQRPFDIIHLHSAKAGILGRIAASITGHKKVIYTPHGATFLRKDVSPFLRKAFLMIEKVVSVFPAKIIGVSKSEADAYKAVGMKADYINNGKFFSQNISKHFNEGAFTVITTGRATRQKNPALLNEIASAFINNPNIKFIWIGDGDERNLLTSSNITITGRLKNDEVLQLLQTAHLYISTALWEGLPYAVLEAMSVKLPLLLNNCAGNTDLVENGVNGFLFNSAAEAIHLINKYFNNRELLQAHSEASFAMLQNSFSAEQMINAYRQLYNSI